MNHLYKMLSKRKRVYGPSLTVAKKRKSKAVPRFKYLTSNSRSSRNQSLRTVVTYSDWITINPGSGVAGTHIYAANGLYDPDITGVGHQPTGFDQMMILYNEYVVLGSTITVHVRSTDTAVTGCPIMCGIFLEDFATPDLDFRKYVENGNGVYTSADIQASGSALKTLRHKADIAKFSNQDVYDEQGFAGSVSANPSDTHYYHIVIAPMDNFSDIPPCQFFVEIRYDVVFKDPSLAQLS